MDLDQYFTRPGAESMATFAQERSMNEGQIRQWRHQYKGRRPGTIACVVLERSTNGALLYSGMMTDTFTAAPHSGAGAAARPGT